MTNWTLTNGAPGQAKQMPPNTSVAASVQATGDFGGGTLSIEVSNDSDNWFPLTQLDGSAAPTLAAPGLVEITTGARFVRPTLAGGSGGSVVVLLASGGI